ncbi:MAG: protein arginine kinase [Candidatus Omnitrophica bacterium]|nr:protein arginine kinase [Candidatus Omnitrophota bacterium]
MFESFFENKKSWLSSEGPDSDIVISTRIRLARNIEGYPFPNRATLAQKNQVFLKIGEAYPKMEHLDSAFFLPMESIDDLDRQFLLERHLISQEHMHYPRGKGLILSRSEVVSIMINEEDHLRMQVIVSGFDLVKAWRIINRIDDDISTHLLFSFSPEIGYLTSCPTNVGTGLRASCMLHLPALVMTKRLDKILELLAKLSFTTRGLFGEGTQALGNFFQISNQVSLGMSEEEIMDSLAGVVKQVKEQELNARENLLKRYLPTLEDSVWRAWGILKCCRLISTKEALSHLSMLRLGVDLGIIKEVSKDIINRFFIMIQPAHLQKIEGKVLKEEERDYIRASLIREKLS